ncbi:MAG: tail fiber domain-containing protein [bacterium]|nr:tail fiber domain-containing protein [bacterium]
MADDPQQQIPNIDNGDENSPISADPQNPEQTEATPNQSSEESTSEAIPPDNEQASNPDLTETNEQTQPEQPDQPVEGQAETDQPPVDASVQDERRVSDLSEQRFYPVENLESQESLDTPTPVTASEDATNAGQQTTAGGEEPKRSRFRNRGAIFAIIIAALLLTALAAVTQLRQGGTSDDLLSKFTEQSVQVDLADAVVNFDGKGDQLVVNGLLTVAASNGASISLSTAGVSGSNVYLFPNGNGTLCIDSNNCGYINSQSINGIAGQIITTAGANSVTLSAGNSICQVSNNCSSVLQNGNSFGGPLVVGTNDGYDIAFETNGTKKIYILNSNGGLAFGVAKDTDLFRQSAGVLRTSGDLSVGNRLVIGNDTSPDICTTFVPECDFVFNAERTYTNVDGVNPGGGFVKVILDPATDPAYGGLISAVGGGFSAEVADGNTANFTGALAGTFGYAKHGGVGHVDVLLGVIGVSDNSSVGDVGISVGGLFSAINRDAGVVSIMAGIAVLPIANLTGTVASGYGIHVESQTLATESYGIAIGVASTQTLWLSSGTDSTTSNGGIAFGLSRDTNLYRSAADTLRTDDALEVGGTLEVASTAEVTGSLGVGVAPGSYKLDVRTDSAGSYVANFFNDGNVDNRYGLRVQAGADAGTGTTYYLDAYDGDGGQVGYIANIAGTFALTDVSDARTKTNVATAGLNALEILGGLRVVDFNRLQNPGGPTITGFIAQEVLGIYPQAVTQGSSGLYGIQKDAFIPVLVKGVQEQQADINDIARRVAALESSDAPLEVNVAQLTANKITVATAKVTGTLEVAGSASIGGSLSLGGNLNLSGAVVGNDDTRGVVTVVAGSTEAKHNFTRTFSSAPNVILTATNSFAPQYRVESTKSGFTVYFIDPQAGDVKLNYQIQL